MTPAGSAYEMLGEAQSNREGRDVGEMGDEERLERLRRNEEIFRQVNDRIVEVAEPFPEVGGDSKLEVVCECARVECTQSIELSVHECHAARSSPNTFVMLLAHVTPELDDVVKREPGYVFARKRV